MSNSDDATKTLKIDSDSDTLKMEKERAKDQPACLIIIRGKPQGKRYILSRPSMIMGRDLTCDIVVDDANASRRHAEILVMESQIHLRDNQSTNGTYLNDKKIEKDTILKKEDMLRIGNTVMKFLPAGELEIMYIGSLESQAHTDALTKAYNKGYIMELLDAEFKRARALHSDLSVAIMDLDHFKKINDSYGHDAGDMVLRETAALIKNRILPKAAVMGRFGGEEFIFILPGIAIDEAMDIAERARGALEKNKFIYEEKTIPVNGSFGVTQLTDTMDTPTTLFKIADKAVYESKSNGRNRVSRGKE